MPLSLAILLIAGAYLAVGCTVGVWVMFVRRARFDPDAREGTLGFRLITLPGAAMLWPWLLAASRRGRPADRKPLSVHHRRAHLAIWIAVSVALAAGLGWAWSLRVHTDQPVNDRGSP